MTDADRQAAVAAYTAMAESGLRTLALARRVVPEQSTIDEHSIERELVLLGLVGIIDPPRPEVPDAMRIAREAGIRVVMITGDAAPTALAIAQRLENGMSHINCSPINDEAHAPFGGTKASGIGRYGGRWSLESFCETRWITFDRGGKQYPPVF